MAQPAGPAPGSAAAVNAGALEEVVVTAQKTTENNQRAPASITSVSAAELDVRGISNLQEVEKLLPSAELRQQGNLVQVYIRGIGSRVDAPNFAASSAFLFNGLVIPRQGNAGLVFDLDRVESIAGPQGTLYGGSAAGGAVNVYTAIPRSDFSGNAAVAIENYSGWQLQGAQNFQISDGVSLRAAGIYNKRGSWYGRDLDTRDGGSGRLSLLIAPSDHFDANIFYNHVEEHGEPNNSLVANPFVNPSNPWTVAATGTPVKNVISGDFTNQSNHSDIIGANIHYGVGSNNFTYTPGYLDVKDDIRKYSGISGGGLLIFDSERQMSHELTWNSIMGAFNWTAGLFYLRNDTRWIVTPVRWTTPTTFTAVPTNVTDQVTEGKSIFAQTVYSAAPDLRITVGGRYSVDSIDAKGTGNLSRPFKVRRDEGHTDYKVGVAYDLSDTAMLYANIQSGYIPFGYDPDSSIPTSIIPTSDLTAYSGGFKSRFFDSRLEVNAEAFYYDYTDFQAIIFNNVTAVSTVLTAKRSSIKGLDVSMRAQVTPTIRVDGGITYQNARYDDFNGVAATGPYNFDGNQMINAPDWKIIFGAQKVFDFGDGSSVVVRADTHYESSHFGNFQNTVNARQPSYITSDASLTFNSADDRWSLQGYVKNIEDEPIWTTMSAGSGSLQAPRTYGLRLSARWQ